MVSTYSGTVVRTTHLSGMWTDLGIFLGHHFARIAGGRGVLRMCFLIISAFFCGGVAGALAFLALQLFRALFSCRSDSHPGRIALGISNTPMRRLPVFFAR